VAARNQEDAEGEKTAGEAAIQEFNLVDGGVGATELWRGAESHERSSRKSRIFWEVRQSKNLKGQPLAKTREGAKNQ
jgi:hypothetical protein